MDNNTRTIDGVAGGVLKCGGLHMLQIGQEQQEMDVQDLSAACRSGSHLAMSKYEGVEINRNNGPLIITLQMHKGRQQGQLRRVQNRVGTEDMLHFQHCVLPGLGCVQFKRLLYNSILSRVQAGKKVVLLMLDLSNGYGQADREILRWQGDKKLSLRWAIEQPLKLYELLEIYIHTPDRVTQPYSIPSGFVQGGGMDPFFYVWLSQLLLGALMRETIGAEVPLGNKL